MSVTTQSLFSKDYVGEDIIKACDLHCQTHLYLGSLPPQWWVVP